MKSLSYQALTAIWFLGASTGGMAAVERCVAYGDENTDFTWRLCPDGEKYERQYRYYGVWSRFYRVARDVGACQWSPLRSSWICPDVVIRCNTERCM